MDPAQTISPSTALALLALVGGGFLLWLVGSIMMFAGAFKQSAWWGIGALILAPVLYIYVGKYWRTAKVGFWIHLLGFGLMAAGLIIALRLGVKVPTQTYTI